MVDQLSDYGYNKTADATSLNSASLTGFPVFVRLESGGDTTGTGPGGLDPDAQIDGIEDFGFFDENGTALDFYAVTVDHTNGVYEFLVRSDLLLDGSTQVEVGYGSGNTDDSVAVETVLDSVPDLESAYLFDGNLQDGTSNNHDAVNGFNSDITFSSGQFGEAADADGDPTLDAIDSNYQNDPNSFSWIGYIYPRRFTQARASNSSSHSTPNPFVHDATSDGNDTWGVGFDENGFLSFYVDDGTGVRQGLGNQHSTDSWYTFGAAYNDGGTIDLFIDGVEEHSNSLSGGKAAQGGDWDFLGDALNSSGQAERGYTDGKMDFLIQLNRQISQNFAEAFHRMSAHAGYSLLSWNASTSTDQPGTVKESSSSLSIKTSSSLSAKTNPV